MTGSWMFWTRVTGQSLRQRLAKARIMFVGIAFSVTTLVFLQAFLNGVYDRMVHNAARFHTGHVSAHWAPDDANDLGVVERVRSLPRVETAVIRTFREGVLSKVGNDVLTPVQLFGIEPARERSFAFVRGWMSEAQQACGPGEIIIGHHMARRLEAKIGDTVEFWAATRVRDRLRVIGILDASLWINPYMAFTALEPVEMVEFLEIAILLDSTDHTDDVSRQLKGIVPARGSVDTWEDRLGGLLEMIQITKAASVFTTVFVAIILAFGISTTVFVSVAERTREFGILKTVGLRPRQISSLVIRETVLLVATAAVVGAILGGPVVWMVIATGGIDLSGSFYRVPFFAVSGVVIPRLTISSILLPLFVTLLSGLVASFLPALRAGHTSVVEALRTL